MSQRHNHLPDLMDAELRPRRRLNPAVVRLLEIVATQRTSKEIQDRYPSMGFAIAAEDRFELKRFIKRVSA